jgi:hypothetical protein
MIARHENLAYVSAGIFLKIKECEVEGHLIFY